MTTIEAVDFTQAGLLRKVGACFRGESLMTGINIMSVIGSAVPAQLREQGLLACWYLVRNGEPVSGPLPSLSAAEALAATLLA